MKFATQAMSLLASALACTVFAATPTLGAGAEGPVPTGVPSLNHVFVIMMENHGAWQVFQNPNAPFINNMIWKSNVAANYFAVAHPSLTNYLEVVGGSNFGVLSDNYPDWHNAGCTPNLLSGTANTDNPPSPSICPIAGVGADAAIAATDSTNEVETPGTKVNNIDGVQSIPALSNAVGKSIADQLVAAGKSYKSYQENLPMVGANQINYSDGMYSNLTDFSKITPALTPPLSSSNIVALYAAKHNPFVYFQSTQEGFDPSNSLANSVSFEGAGGLWADLGSGNVPSFSFISPNQCNDMHGRGNSTAFCNYDPSDDGSQSGLNPALIRVGDNKVEMIVTAIKASKAWSTGRNAIVLLWDENDYSSAPNTNQVLTLVQTNYQSNSVISATKYNHFSLLKTMEGALGLPCLNHACDSGVQVMSDLFN